MQTLELTLEIPIEWSLVDHDQIIKTGEQDTVNRRNCSDSVIYTFTYYNIEEAVKRAKAIALLMKKYIAPDIDLYPCHMELKQTTTRKIDWREPKDSRKQNLFK